MTWIVKMEALFLLVTSKLPINQFHATGLFHVIGPLAFCFQGYRKRQMAWNGLRRLWVESLWKIDISPVIRQEGEPQNVGNKKTKHVKLSEKRTFLTPCKKCSFLGKFGLLCFLETPVLRFGCLPYYQRFGNDLYQQDVDNSDTDDTSQTLVWLTFYSSQVQTCFHM